MGRRLKFGESMIKREFRFPETLSNRLNNAVIGGNVSNFVRDAIEEKLDRDASGAEITLQQIKTALEQAQASIEAKPQQSGDAFKIPLNDDEREQMRVLAQELGFKSPEHYVLSVVRTSLKKPRESLREWLYGSLERIGAQRAAAKTTRKRAG